MLMCTNGGTQLTIERLISFGDSCIFGSELGDVVNDTTPSKLTYPALIAEQLELEYLCLAKPGASNQHIVKTILDYPFRGTEIAIIQWTNSARFGLPLDDGWSDMSPNLDDMDSAKLLSKEFYARIEIDKFSKLQFKMCVDTVKQTLRSQYIMTSNDVAPVEDGSIVKFDGKNFLDFCKPFPHGDKNHPLEQAHSEAAKCIQPVICDILSNFNVCMDQKTLLKN